MLIDDDIILKLEKLSMIKVKEDQKEALKQEMSEIVSKMECLRDINTDEIMLDSNLKTPFRDDIPIDSQIRDSILDIAPRADSGFFIVHKIL